MYYSADMSEGSTFLLFIQIPITHFFSFKFTYTFTFTVTIHLIWHFEHVKRLTSIARAQRKYSKTLALTSSFFTLTIQVEEDKSRAASSWGGIEFSQAHHFFFFVGAHKENFIFVNALCAGSVYVRLGLNLKRKKVFSQFTRFIFFIGCSVGLDNIFCETKKNGESWCWLQRQCWKRRQPLTRPKANSEHILDYCWQTIANTYPSLGTFLTQPLRYLAKKK